MVQINLMPWREQAKQTKKTQFSILSILIIFLALIAVAVTHVYYKRLINHQLQRNQYLQTELEKEQSQLTTLISKKNQQETLQTALNFLMGLRQESYRAVQLLDALVRAVPETVSLKKIIREGNHITLIGSAKSDAQVTLLMDNLAKMKLFQQPTLTKITSSDTTEMDERVFQLKIEQK